MTDPLDLEGCYRLTESTADRDETTETFTPTPFAGSPWGPHLQHGGPVAALLTRAMDRLNERPETRLSRISVEILGPVPMEDLLVRAWVERPGRRIELLAAEMCSTGVDQRPVARARAWRMRTTSTDNVLHHADSPLPTPDLHRGPAGPEDPDLPASWKVGFVHAVHWHLVTEMGTFGTPTSAWMHMTQPLVHGEPLSPLEQTVAIADVANGIGARLEWTEWRFLNTEMTIHLFEPPHLDWVGLEAETSIGSDGIAMSAAVIHSLQGPIGRVTQNVLAEPLVQ